MVLWMVVWRRATSQRIHYITLHFTLLYFHLLYYMYFAHFHYILLSHVFSLLIVYIVVIAFSLQNIGSVVIAPLGRIDQYSSMYHLHFWRYSRNIRNHRTSIVVEIFLTASNPKVRPKVRTYLRGIQSHL